MTRGNTLVLIIVLMIFAFAVCALVYPLFGRDEMRLGLDLQGGIHMVYQADFSEIEPGGESDAINGAIAVIERRINVFGVLEPVIQRQGDDRILVELPGVSEAEEAKELIGETALIEFREQVTNEDGETEWVPLTGTIDGQERVLSSAYFQENTYVSQDNLGRIILVFEWSEEGMELCAQITPRILGQPMGVFLSGEPLLSEEGYPIAPTVNDPLEECNTITGLSYTDASELSELLNAGRIPVPLTPIYEQTVTPTLGEDFIDMSLKAGIIGIILVMLFMIIYYRLPGLLASIALIFYGSVVLAIFKLIPVTLTLAGIGGFILSIGMAVDANVLIFERMKEEFRMGRTLGAAIEAGFNRAWAAIRDSNVTTLIVCVILIWLGSSIAESAPVTGFAVTLLIGVLVSMFSAIIVTRTLLRLFVHTPLARKTGLFSAYQVRKDV
jgi:preprotein translocase subunit SecD